MYRMWYTHWYEITHTHTLKSEKAKFKMAIAQCAYIYDSTYTALCYSHEVHFTTIINNVHSICVHNIDEGFYK